MTDSLIIIEPRSPEPSRRPATGASIMPVAANIETLIVDDQRSTLQLIRSCLLQLGFARIHECEDGEAALRLLQTVRVHLIFSDLNMPKLDGLGLLRAVRGDPAIAKTAFIMLTGRADTALVQEAVKLGVNNYIVKPFNLETMKKKIQAVVGPLT
jgi:two-component system chemotaxis response regulator CheY